MTIRALLLLLTIASILSGCHPPRIVPDRGASVVAYVDPYTRVYHYKTFAVIPYAQYVGTSDEVTRDDQLIAFAVVDGMIRRGYSWVRTIDSADMIVAVKLTEWDGLHDPIHEHEEIPFYPRISFNPVSKFDFGTLDTVPIWQRQSVSGVAAEPVRRRFPKLRLLFLDRIARKPVLCLDGDGAFESPALVVAAQHVLRDLVPQIEYGRDILAYHRGRTHFGMVLETFSLDGFNFWPTVSSVSDESGAANAGIRENDMLLSVDGVSLKNMLLQDVLDILKSDAPVTRTLRVWKNQLGVRTISTTSGY